LAHLLYGINESGGFIQLTGEVGTGKTPSYARCCRVYRITPMSR